MQLFNIAGVNLTSYIVAPSYEINQQDEYKEWEDGFYITHRDFKRTRISGKFTMKFRDKEKYYFFLKLLNDNKTSDGYIPASLYINNINEVKESNFFILIKPANTVPLFNKDTHKGFTVTIKEQ